MLKRVHVPMLVLHGADDPLIPVEGGQDTAALIPGAQLHIIPGMGHDLATGLLPIIVDAITKHCKAADASTWCHPVGGRHGRDRNIQPPSRTLLALEPSGKRGGFPVSFVPLE